MRRNSDGAARFSGAWLLCLAMAAATAGPTAQPQDPAEGADYRMSVGSLTWSANGHQLLFSAMRTRSDWSDFSPDKWGLYLVHWKTGETRELAAGTLSGDLSPDGRRLAYEKRVDGNQEIFVRDVESGEEVNLTGDPAKDSAPRWSPDGKWLAFNSDRSGEVEIFVVPSDGGAARRVTHSGGHKSYNPEWSPSGDRLTYYLEQGDGKDQIYRVDVSGENVVNLTDDQNHSYFPRWTPTGRILFTSGSDETWIMDSDGGNRARLEGRDGVQARYSRDGRLAFSRAEDRAIYVETTAGGPLQRVFGMEDLVRQLKGGTSGGRPAAAPGPRRST